MPHPRAAIERHGVLGAPETTDRESDMCRPNSGAGGAEMPNSKFGIDTDAETRRIDTELVKSTAHGHSGLPAGRSAYALQPGMVNKLLTIPRLGEIL